MSAPARGLALLALGAALGLAQVAHASDFEWIGKIELEAEGLSSPEDRKRREAVTALGKYDIAITKGYLLKALSDPDVRVRSEAGRILGKNKVVAAAPIIIDWLSDPDPLIKQEAANILADLATDAAVQALIRSLGDPDERVRERATTALGKIGTPQVVVPLIGRLEDDKSEVRRVAIEQLATLGDRRAVIPLVGAFTDPNVEVRKAAVLAVGGLGDRAAVPALLRVLRDAAEDLRQVAVTSLGNLRATQATAELIAQLGTGSDSYQSKVAYALGRIARHGAQGTDAERAAADRAMRALVQALASRGVRAAASEALRHADAAAVPALIAHIEGELDGDLLTAVELLRDIGDGRATAVLVAELDRGRVPRTLLLEALARGGDPGALMPVLRLLSSPDAELRLQAMNTLRPLITDQRAADVIAAMLGDAELEIRILAAEYLGLMRARSAVPRLLELVGAGKPERLRLAAVDALGEIADARAGAPLVDLLRSGPIELGRAAASALIYIGDPALASALIELGRGMEGLRREHALRALGGIHRDRPDDRVRAVLEAMARSSDLGVSLTAIEALGAMGARAGVPVLVELARLDSHRRRAAATALGNLGDRAATPVLIEALAVSDDRVSGDAAWALGKLGDERALEPLLAATRRRGWATAINASAALARVAPPAYADRLVPLLYHRSRFVRANAAMALARLWPTLAGEVRDTAERALVHTLRKDASWLARVAAARALSHAPGARQALAEAAERERDGRVRQAALDALAQPFAPPARTEWRSFHVVDTARDHAPARQEPYFLAASDGLVTALYTDARGMATEEALPPGDLILKPRSSDLRF